MLSGVHDDESYEKGLALYESIMAAMPGVTEGTFFGGEIGALAWIEDLLGRVLSEYADQRWPADIAEGDLPVAILRVLIDENGLKQSDLPEIGTQGVVSEILSGKRELNVRQIRALANRFDIPQHYFLAG